MRRKQRRISGAFIPYELERAESPAWHVSPDAVRRLLDRLEREHMRHAGRENGRLGCSYEDFEAVGLRRGSIGTAIRQAEALGFVEVVARGYKASGTFWRASSYRLTYLPAHDNTDPTNEWRRLTTIAEATAALLAVPLASGARRCRRRA